MKRAAALVLGIGVSWLGAMAGGDAGEAFAPGHFEATPESLAQAEVPEWFLDAKLGIFMHWGPESIPGVASTWYARWMYEQGSEGYKYHCATYGHPSKVGYKDICKLFTAPKFDQAQADRLVALYKQAGARYVVPVASHHDNFDMWDSKFQPRWNSMATAGKDVVGMWQKAAAKHGLRLGVASHVARTFRWFQTSHGADKTGPLAGVPYDGQDPQFADLYGVPWNSTDPGYEGTQDVGPPGFEKHFEQRMLDLIDRYRPDLYYTDGGPPFPHAGYNIVAHLYNENRQRNGGRLEAVANFKGGCRIGAHNYEFEFPASLQERPWQTDKTMSPEWYWLRDRTKEYRKGFEIVHTLIDIVSKNGNLLLNVPLTGEGELEDATVTMLEDMGHDFALIGEAIFGTRTWEAFGEGQRGFNNIGSGTARDIRFTRNKENTVLYATTLGWPGDGAVVEIKTLGKARIDLKSLQSIALTGVKSPLVWRQDSGALQVSLPAKAPYACSAYPLKLTFAGKIPKLKPPATWLWQARVRDITDDEDKEAYGLAAPAGLLVIDTVAGGDAARAGLRAGDVITAANGVAVGSVAAARAITTGTAGAKLTLEVTRQRQPARVVLDWHLFLANDRVEKPEFAAVPLAPPGAVLPVRIATGGSTPFRTPVDVVLDGRVERGKGLTFPNGVDDGMIKLDLAATKAIDRINTYSSGRTRARQSFTLYASNAASDPGWNVADPTIFTPLVTVDARPETCGEYEATSIRRADGKPIGHFRWLLWVGSPVLGDVGGENTTFEELQVIEAK